VYCYGDLSPEIFNFGPALIVGNDELEKLNPATFALLQQIHYRVYLLSIFIETTLDLLQLLLFGYIQDFKNSKWKKLIAKIRAVRPIDGSVEGVFMKFHKEYRGPGVGLILVLIVLLPSGNSGGYHLREFENIKTNFNNYRPSVIDRIKGIRDSQGKWDFHLRRLEELGVAQHKTFVFTEVPYTKEASKRIWGSANSNFPNAIMFSASYYGTNAPGYGVDPYVLKVWDSPSEMKRWVSFFETNNHRQ
jgi:hypothetical protein